MQSGEPRGSVTVENALRFNDIEVAGDGAIWASQTGTEESDSWRVYRIDPDGNIVVVNVNDTAVLTFSPDGELIRTEHAVDGGNDGLVVLDDGTKHPERRLDGLRLEAEPAPDPDERLERHHDRRSRLIGSEGASWSTCSAPSRSGSGKQPPSARQRRSRCSKQQGRATGGVAPYGFQFIDGRRAWHQGEQETLAAIIEHRGAGLRQAERHRGWLQDAGRGGALSAAGQERARFWRVATLHTYQGGRRPADNGAQVGKAQVGVG